MSSNLFHSRSLAINGLLADLFAKSEKEIAQAPAH